MTPLARFLSRIAEKVAERYYEGPAAPQRLAEEVQLFRVIYPDATPDEWTAFATRLAGNAYCSGYQRGFEYVERDPNPPEPDQELLERLRHDWSLADGHPLIRDMVEQGRDPASPLAGLTPEQRAEYFDTQGRILGTHRVVQLDARGMPLGGP